MHRPHRPGYLFMTLLMIFGILSIGAAWIAPATSVTAQETPSANPTTEPKVQVVQQVSPAVVTVHNMTTGGGLLGQAAEPQLQGAGTGFVISKDGYIVTNWHVVTGGDAFEVVFRDGKTADAELIGQDAFHDLAVVKVDPKWVTATVAFANSDDVLPGQTVLAIGSPLGSFQNTVTDGIISATNRNLDQPGMETSGQCQQYNNLLQHDAPINPGNSGGPLFDMQGNVVGVNTLGIPSDQNGTPIQGIFFAVPANTVKTAVDQMIKTGTVTVGYLGASYIEFTPELLQQSQVSLPVQYGAIFTAVESGSPANKAGLRRGDVVTAVNGTEITSSDTFSELMQRQEPGTSTTLTVLHEDGSTEDVSVTLTETQVDPSQCTLNPGQ